MGSQEKLNKAFTLTGIREGRCLDRLVIQRKFLIFIQTPKMELQVPTCLLSLQDTCSTGLHTHKLLISNKG
ncbi:hypothetical protein DCAR_0207093 [Daucus carota subsp. sativus]|uniref:Uncharacterized protein n=1 Tax=Daucus carota subsp. sativus TaxID=79200 RepID=A0A166DMX0_DAUCS|nr:hypothetical protein DCAR_0207093 [Daucus carota subsp. sativus]